MRIPNETTTKNDGFRPLLPAQVRAIMKPGADPSAYGTGSECRCIGCGCTDTHGCITEHGPCHWLRLDTIRGIGVCSECEHTVKSYDEARRPHGTARRI